MGKSYSYWKDVETLDRMSRKEIKSSSGLVGHGRLTQYEMEQLQKMLSQIKQEGMSVHEVETVKQCRILVK